MSDALAIEVEELSETERLIYAAAFVRALPSDHGVLGGTAMHVVPHREAMLAVEWFRFAVQRA